MEAVHRLLFEFMREFGAGLSIVIVALIIVLRVAPEWIKARIENDKARASANIKKIEGEMAANIRKADAEADTIRKLGDAMTTSMPAAWANVAVELVSTRGQISESAAATQSHVTNQVTDGVSVIKNHVSQELDKRLEAKFDGVVNMLSRKSAEHADHSPNTERASVRGAPAQT